MKKYPGKGRRVCRSGCSCTLSATCLTTPKCTLTTDVCTKNHFLLAGCRHLLGSRALRAMSASNVDIDHMPCQSIRYTCHLKFTVKKCSCGGQSPLDYPATELRPEAMQGKCPRLDFLILDLRHEVAGIRIEVWGHVGVKITAHQEATHPNILSTSKEGCMQAQSKQQLSGNQRDGFYLPGPSKYCVASNEWSFGWLFFITTSLKACNTSAEASLRGRSLQRKRKIYFHSH